MEQSLNYIKKIANHNFFKQKNIVFGLWMLLGFVSAILKIHNHNNFLIFKGVFFHTWNQLNLYDLYPDEYGDINHYGPLFSLIMAPFAIIPIDWLALILWHLFLSWFLWWAIHRVTLSWSQQLFCYWFCAHELLTALFMSQFNIAVCALILLSFADVERNKEWRATIWIVIGTFVKLYGIVGIAFFFFSKDKKKFICYLLLWSVVAFCLPMIISSPYYICQQYIAWFTDIIEKSNQNLLSVMQNVSLLGMIRKIPFIISGGYAKDGFLIGGMDLKYPDTWIIATSAVVMSIGFFRVHEWRNKDFRFAILALVLMCVVLLSTGSESSGYIIAFVGCCIWYCCVPWKRTKVDIALMIFAFILTSMSPSDLFPVTIKKEYVQPMALKALPVALIWIKLIYEIIFKHYGFTEFRHGRI